jgi:hypothetical protein
MNRRNFIEKTGLLAGAAMLPIRTLTMDNLPKYKMGYQLFSIRDEMAKDPLATLKALKSFGYMDFEAYGFDEIK